MQLKGGDHRAGAGGVLVDQPWRGVDQSCPGSRVRISGCISQVRRLFRTIVRLFLLPTSEAGYSEVPWTRLFSWWGALGSLEPFIVSLFCLYFLFLIPTNIREYSGRKGRLSGPGPFRCSRPPKTGGEGMVCPSLQVKRGFRGLPPAQGWLCGVLLGCPGESLSVTCSVFVSASMCRDRSCVWLCVAACAERNRAGKLSCRTQGGQTSGPLSVTAPSPEHRAQGLLGLLHSAERHRTPGDAETARSCSHPARGLSSPTQWPSRCAGKGPPS